MVKNVTALCLVLAFGMAIGQSGEQYRAQQEQIKIAIQFAAECEERGEWSKAKTILWGANETFPGDRHITYKLALLQIRDKDYASALKTFRSAPYDREMDPQRYSYVGYLILKCGDAHASRELWTPDLIVKEGRRYPDWRQMLPDTSKNNGLEAAWLIAIAYWYMPDDTLSSWQAVLALEPNNSIAAGNAARLFDNRKEWEKAIALYETAIKSSVPGEWRDNLNDRLIRARWYKDRGDGGR